MTYISDYSIILLWLQSLSDKHVKLHTVAAGNNRDHTINTLAAGLRIYIVLGNQEKKQGYFSWLNNRIAPQPILLESCLYP